MPAMTSPKRSAPPVPSPSNPVLVARQSQWIFTDAELHRTPSALDGMEIENEHVLRSKGVNFITQVGVLLKLPQLTLSTASVYLHRFFMRYSMVDLPQRQGIHPYSIAATALFLATKVEENCRKMRELIVACCRVALKQPNLVVDEQSKEFWRWRDTILHNEDLLLEALCFDLQLEQPYRLLYDFLCYFGMQDDKRLRNAAWAFVNDSTFSVLCVQFHARTIAAAALYAAARHCEAAFEDDALGRPWWEQINADLSEIRRACDRMAELYEKYPLPNRGLKYPASPMNGEQGQGQGQDAAAEKTRQMNRQRQSQSQSQTEEDRNNPNPSSASMSRSSSGSAGTKRERGEGTETSPVPHSTNTNGAAAHDVETERSPKRQKREPSEEGEEKEESEEGEKEKDKEREKIESQPAPPTSRIPAGARPPAQSQRVPGAYHQASKSHAHPPAPDKEAKG